ncbi:hypothetical protein FAF44_17090 [Nonomuraea sp. MG754425]|uniref:hypothetical protein n=1 Tax=Nonomuraea sp. MG754425 TaxID=2570319 RepID=UPI001F3178AD|nr:hypothetical protein [Nonomuraea sp. MG754425]MCF6470099.1 hypothetical protein [Nonomuraea sp. MG754425]
MSPSAHSLGRPGAPGDGPKGRMSLLERRYRSVLRLLPASYRAEREEEMVDAFMEMSGDVPDELSPRPRWGEIASVLALAVRSRLGGTGAPPHLFAWGETVRLVALLGLAHQAMGGLYTGVELLRTLVFGAEQSYAGAPGSFERLVAVVVSVSALCSTVAFVAIIRGHVRTAKVTAVVGAAPTLVYTLIPMILAGPVTDRPLSEPATLVFTVVPVLALLLGFHGDVAPRRRPWALALAPAAAGLAVLGGMWLLLALRLPDAGWLYLWLDLGTAIPVWAAGAVVVLTRPATPSWALAMSATGLLLLMVRLTGLGGLPDGPMWATACAQCALLWALAVPLAWAGARRLPSPAPQP